MDNDRQPFIEAQARADSVAKLFASQAPPSLQEETLGAYRARLMSPFQAHSPTWKQVNLHKIASDSAALDAAEAQVYKDAVAAATRNNPGDPLRAVTSVDNATGHRVTRFFGDPMQAWLPFMGAGVRYLIGIDKHAGR